jgi:hypothetical protein
MSAFSAIRYLGRLPLEQKVLATVSAVGGGFLTYQDFRAGHGTAKILWEGIIVAAYAYLFIGAPGLTRFSNWLTRNRLELN